MGSLVARLPATVGRMGLRSGLTAPLGIAARRQQQQQQQWGPPKRGAAAAAPGGGEQQPGQAAQPEDSHLFQVRRRGGGGAGAWAQLTRPAAAANCWRQAHCSRCTAAAPGSIPRRSHPHPSPAPASQGILSGILAPYWGACPVDRQFTSYNPPCHACCTVGAYPAGAARSPAAAPRSRPASLLRGPAEGTPTAEAAVGALEERYPEALLAFDHLAFRTFGVRGGWCVGEAGGPRRRSPACLHRLRLLPHSLLPRLRLLLHSPLPPKTGGRTGHPLGRHPVHRLWLHAARRLQLPSQKAAGGCLWVGRRGRGDGAAAPAPQIAHTLPSRDLPSNLTPLRPGVLVRTPGPRAAARLHL
jgi:hypothetical protein